MKAATAKNMLAEITHTIGKLKDPYILSVGNDLFGYGYIHLYCESVDEFLDMCDGQIGNDLYEVEHNYTEGVDQYYITDTNGVKVYCLQDKAAPEAGTSEAAKDEEEVNQSSPSIIGAGGQEVKEEE